VHLQAAVVINQAALEIRNDGIRRQPSPIGSDKGYPVRPPLIAHKIHDGFSLG